MRVRGADERRSVLVVQGEVSGRRLDRFEVSDARRRHVECVCLLEAELGGDFHRRGGLEVLASNSATDDEVDLVDRRTVHLEAFLRGLDGVVGNARFFARLEVAHVRLAHGEDALNGRFDGRPFVLGAPVVLPDSAEDFGVIDAGCREGHPRL